MMVGSPYIGVNVGAWHAGRVSNPSAKLKKNRLGQYINPNKYDRHRDLTDAAHWPHAGTGSVLARACEGYCDTQPDPIRPGARRRSPRDFRGEECPGPIKADSLLMSEEEQIAQLRELISQLTKKVVELLATKK